MTKTNLKTVCYLLTFPFMLASIIGCSGPINTNYDQHFTEEGYLITDVEDSIVFFVPESPNAIKFYVEVSGSMNGFFRANKSTDFKSDLWQVMSYFSGLMSNVSVLTNNGEIGNRLILSDFRQKMNTGAFVSTASTKVPVMLEAIFSDINPNAGEVGVLVSDMKYSPVGLAAQEVLLSQYSTDIARILAKSGYATSLLLATSSYLDKHGNNQCPTSPYYYLIFGDPRQVAYMRNGISTLLDDAGHFVDNIESGFDYGAMNYSFGIPKNCFHMDDETPTFCGYDALSDDTCTIEVKVRLENYRWRMADEAIFSEAFSAKCLYGSDLVIGPITISVENKTNKELNRVAEATVELKVCNMATDSEVIEWGLELPDTERTMFAPYIENVDDENDINKSYSVDSFIQGMFYGSNLNKPLKQQYILISQNS